VGNVTEDVMQLTGQLADRDAWAAEHCSIAEALEVVSTRSAFLILREAFYGTTRFDEFVSRTRLSEPVAATRLRELVEHGLLEREPYRVPGQRTRQRYRLTAKGADLLPALLALKQWGDRWLDEHGGPLEMRHHDCGERIDVELRCAGGHRVEAGDIDVAVHRRWLRRRQR
jgi:DNA-binding HxlR family transcriptional regulator